MYSDLADDDDIKLDPKLKTSLYSTDFDLNDLNDEYESNCGK